MPKATTFANDMLDHTYKGGASGTYTVGGTTYTLPLKLRFLSTLSTDSSAGTELTGGSYPSGGVSLSGNFATPAASKQIQNTTAITVTNAPATTWADCEIVDSTGTPKRIVFKGTPSLAKTVNSGDTISIPISSLTGLEV